MATNKEKSVWFCSACGAESAKWQGKCPSCGEWNTLVEERVRVSRNRSTLPGELTRERPLPVSAIETKGETRIKMPSQELNRVLGGGLVTGSLVLLAGEPGIGKSTLVLQNLLAIKSKTILYASGEESASQLKLRAERIGRSSDNCFIVCTSSLEDILSYIEQVQPGIVVVDSIQTIASEALDSAPGSVSQVRECAARLLQFAKVSNVPVLLVGHINKEGSIAGPKVLEHIVDAVLLFEGDNRYMYRVLRPMKNRFGSTGELGIYEMCQRGLREIKNPSEMLMSHATDADGRSLSGAAIGVTIDGLRPFMIEVQALVSSAAYGTPQRSVTGFDSKRMNMLLAVLEKRVGFRLGQKDVFLNIAGGLKVNDPALDLAIVAAVGSSNADIAIDPRTCLTGEVGLSGEVRHITRIEQRISEAARLGMNRIIIPRGNLKGIEVPASGIEIVEVARVDDVFRALFG